MLGLNILNVIISLCFIFFLSSLLASWVYEVIANLLKKRASNLRKVLYDMIGGGDDKEKEVDLLKKLYEHSLIKEHTRKGNDPEYIPDKRFGFVILDILKKEGEEAEKKSRKKTEKEIDIELIRTGVERIKNPLVRKKLLLFIDTARAVDGDLNKKIASVQKHIEDWFDNMMKRATDLYKRYLNVALFIIGLGIAGMLNIDSIQLVNSLWYDSELREAVSNAATEYVKESIESKTQKAEEVMDVYKELDALMIGWDTYTLPIDQGTPAVLMSIFFKVLGIIISALAISQGSPFWYDLLMKMTRIRKVVKPKIADTT